MPPAADMSSPERSLLGEGFLIGVATSGYQVEGGYNGDGQPHNNWAAWEGAGKAARSGLACDFWRHPEEALDRAAAIGCNAFRLSVEWARLEPRPGVSDDAALERYAAILAMCVAIMGSAAHAADVPASAAAPSGDSLRRRRASANRPRSRAAIST